MNESDSEMALVVPVPMATDRIAYSTPPAVSRWQQFLAGALIGVSHTIAAGFTFVVVTCLPFAVYAIFISWEFISSAFSDLDGPPPIMVPFILLAILLFSAFLFLMAGCLVTAVSVVMGICVDTFRRAMRWSFWLMPFLVTGLHVLVWPLLTLAWEQHGWASLLDGLWLAAAFTGLFLAYWLGLFFSEGIMRVAKWLFEWFVESVRNWWKRLRAPSTTTT